MRFPVLLALFPAVSITCMVCFTSVVNAELVKIGYRADVNCDVYYDDTSIKPINESVIVLSPGAKGEIKKSEAWSDGWYKVDLMLIPRTRHFRAPTPASQWIGCSDTFLIHERKRSAYCLAGWGVVEDGTSKIKKRTVYDRMLKILTEYDKKYKPHDPKIRSYEEKVDLESLFPIRSTAIISNK